MMHAGSVNMHAFFMLVSPFFYVYNGNKRGDTMIDGHMHLENGPLNVDYALKFVKAGVEKGMDVIKILDHTHRFFEFAPLYEPLKAAAPQQEAWFAKKKLVPIQVYFDLIEKMKQMDLPIRVEFGLEVCFDPAYTSFLRNLLAQYPYDFIIGSIHSIDGVLYDMPQFSRELLWDVRNTDEIYQRYYEIMMEMIESELFTQIGHPDQLKLFHYTPSYDLYDTYCKIADLAKKHKVAMEHNTGIHYRYKHEDIGTNSTFLKILKDRGVDIVTASDAHQSQHVGMLIPEAIEMLNRL